MSDLTGLLIVQLQSPGLSRLSGEEPVTETFSMTIRMSALIVLT